MTLHRPLIASMHSMSAQELVREECLKAAQAVGLAGYFGHLRLKGHRTQHISLDVCIWQEACSSGKALQKMGVCSLNHATSKITSTSNLQPNMIVY